MNQSSLFDVHDNNKPRFKQGKVLGAGVRRLIASFGFDAVQEALVNQVPDGCEACPTCGGVGVLSAERVAEMMERPGAHSGAKTSRKAGTTPTKGTQRHQVLLELRRRGAMTAHSIAQHLGKSPNQIATRLGELHDDGFVEYLRGEDGAIVEEPTTPGNTGMVHALNHGGIRVLGVLDAQE